MNKRFAIVMALFLALAGCMESVEDELNGLSPSLGVMIVLL